MSAPDSHSVFASLSLRGKNALVTGGATGIGWHIAHAFAEAGANVAITFHTSRDKATECTESIEKYCGVEVMAVEMDVRDAESVETGVQEVMQRFGSLDIVVANAGIGAWADISGMDLDQWKNIVGTNYDGAFHLARVVGPIFKRQGRGNFIATASMSGHIVNVPYNQGAYNSSKAGLIHLCKSLAVEWKGFARVNTVSPGFVNTGLSGAPEAQPVLKRAYKTTPLGRMADPRELKGIFLYLASDASSFTTGADFIVDGGYTIV